MKKTPFCKHYSHSYLDGIWRCWGQLKVLEFRSSCGTPNPARPKQASWKKTPFCKNYSLSYLDGILSCWGEVNKKSYLVTGLQTLLVSSLLTMVLTTRYSVVHSTSDLYSCGNAWTSTAARTTTTAKIRRIFGPDFLYSCTLNEDYLWQKRECDLIGKLCWIINVRNNWRIYPFISALGILLTRETIT